MKKQELIKKLETLCQRYCGLDDAGVDRRILDKDIKVIENELVDSGMSHDEIAAYEMTVLHEWYRE